MHSVYQLTLLLAVHLPAAWASLSQVPLGVAVNATDASTACLKIAQSISDASEVFYPGSDGYAADIEHWAGSSSQPATCSVEPGTPQDVGLILEILGATRTPFAVKGGGHSSNPGHSSTPGVQVSMTRFNALEYDEGSKQATVGAGMIWDDVYLGLEPFGVSILGARTMGVGVAGFILSGGGYGWSSNQYGLTIDTVRSFELIFPNGTIADVTESSDPELFFALKGGGNNFGIVSRFTMQTFPQSEVWGGGVMYSGVSDVLALVLAAIAELSEHPDPKVSAVHVLTVTPGGPMVFAMLFYDGPSPPAGIFDSFEAIPSIMKDLETRSFISYLKAVSLVTPRPARAVLHTVPVLSHPMAFVETIFNETMFWSASLSPGATVSYVLEPMHPSLLSHTSSPSASPPDRSRIFCPLGIFFTWDDPADDEMVYESIHLSAANIRAEALDQGQDLEEQNYYPNYSMFDTPARTLFGKNLERLRELKKVVDPLNVMGLAGGFKV